MAFGGLMDVETRGVSGIGGQVGMQFQIGGRCGLGWSLASLCMTLDRPAFLERHPVGLSVDSNW